MLTDANTSELNGKTIEAALCVIGGGAAGITIARLLAQNTDVVLLESGGTRPNPETQKLNQAKVIGSHADYAMTSRLRYLGGTTNHWGGYCTPYDEEDFEAKPWVPHSGWPVTFGELEPYYHDAQKICDLSTHFSYDPHYWMPDRLKNQQMPGIEIKMWQNSFWQSNIWSMNVTQFGPKYLKELEKQERLKGFLNTNVTHIQLAPNGKSVEHVECATLGGKRFKVRAKHYVLACGGMENARLLLSADDVMKTGIGGQSDWLGRCFMDHRECTVGMLFHDRKVLPLRPSSAYVKVLDAWIRTNMTLSPDIRKRHELLNNAFRLEFPEKLEKMPPQMLQWMALAGKPEADQGSYSVTVIHCIPEHSPCRDSRITLCEDRDPLGMRRLQLDVNYNPDDHKRLLRSVEIMAGILAAEHRGRFRYDPQWFENPNGDSRNWNACHHAGTTRMAHDQGQGVVDTNQRVFGVENLYVAGSSVFPNHSWKVPTLTIVAMSLRLARHLSIRMNL